MKKAFVFFLTIAFTILNINICNALDGDLQNDAKMIAESKLTIPDSYKSYSSYIDIKPNSVNYIFSWSGESTQNTDGGYITATLDDKFRIIKYSQYKYGKFDGDFKLSSVTYDEACVKITNSLKNIIPEFMNKVRIYKTTNYIERNGGKYNVLFYRYENNVPYFDNYITAVFDPYTKELSEFNVVWDDFNKISPNNYKISKTNAIENYMEKIGIEQEYFNTDYGASIRYALNANGKDFINAYNGEIIHTNSPLPASSTNYDRIPNDFDKEYQPVEDSKLFTHFETYLRNIDELGITKGFSITKSETLTDELENEFLEIIFTNKNEQNISVTINTKTKKICAVTSDDAFFDYVQPVSDSRCYFLADGFCEKYLADIYAECKIAKGISFSDSKNYQIRFSRMVNGIPYNNNGIYISIDKSTLKINKLSVSWDDVSSFISPSLTITPKTAYEILLNDSKFDLFYVNTRGNSGNELRLCYGFLPIKPIYVDSILGNLIDKNGEKINLQSNKECIDILNHNDYKYINTLFLSGIEDKEEYFYPDEFITQYDYLTWCFRALDLGNECDYDYMIENQMINEDEIAPDGLINREEAIKYLIELLGYKDIADLSDTYKGPYTDEFSISENLRGYAAIAYGMGIIKGNAFMPKETLKRCVAAEIIYNLISEQEM